MHEMSSKAEMYVSFVVLDFRPDAVLSNQNWFYRFAVWPSVKYDLNLASKSASLQISMLGGMPPIFW